MVISDTAVTAALIALSDVANDVDTSSRACYVIEAVLGEDDRDIPSDVVMMVQDAIADTAKESTLSQARYVAETILEASENYVHYNVVPTTNQVIERMFA